MRVRVGWNAILPSAALPAFSLAERDTVENMDTDITFPQTETEERRLRRPRAARDTSGGSGSERVTVSSVAKVA